jgi:hypothetical protein
MWKLFNKFIIALYSKSLFSIWHCQDNNTAHEETVTKCFVLLHGIGSIEILYCNCYSIYNQVEVFWVVMPCHRVAVEETAVKTLKVTIFDPVSIYCILYGYQGSSSRGSAVAT